MSIKLTRSFDGPILTAGSETWQNHQVYNPAVVEYQGQTALIYRAQGDDRISRLGFALLDDDGQISYRHPDPIFAPDPTNHYETLGVEDPRIVRFNNQYYMIYTAASYYPDIREETYERSTEERPTWRVRVSLASTRDFRSFNRYGVVVDHIDSKDGTLFPQTFSQRYLLVHRVLPDMRLAVSHDIENYSERGPFLSPRHGKFDSLRVGAGAPPIKTKYGWLLFYHGADKNNHYHLGVVVADLHDPAQILVRSDEPVLSPEKSFERHGLVPNVVFTCGAIVSKDKYHIYYGAADQAIAVASITKKELHTWIEKSIKKDTK